MRKESGNVMIARGDAQGRRMKKRRRRWAVPNAEVMKVNRKMSKTSSVTLLSAPASLDNIHL